MYALQLNINMSEVVVIIPALDEEQSIGMVLADIPWKIVSEVVVVNNDSRDSTGEIARNAGATVIDEPRRGYGSACLRGIEYIQSRRKKADIAIFLDGDYSDYPEEISKLLQPIMQHDYDLVIGSRLSGELQAGAMSSYQKLGNRITTALIKLFYKASYTDLGPFRAIKFDRLLQLGMQEKTFGWTAEMQVKAAKQHLRYCEVPVTYRPRIGSSKISGTARGALLASCGIIATILKNI
jgi:glycosyltransferase involved in cell wall biosynthesis